MLVTVIASPIIPRYKFDSARHTVYSENSTLMLYCILRVYLLFVVEIKWFG